MDFDNLDATNGLLRVVIALLLRQMGEQKISLREQVGMLDDLGVKPSEIAKIVGRSNTYVSKELAGIRKGKRKG